MTSRRRALACVGATALALPLLAGLSPAEAAKPSPAAAPNASPAVPLVGERFEVTGRLGTTARAVKLQRRDSAGRWETIRNAKTTKAGRYTFTTRTTATAVALRVLAPESGDKEQRRTKAVGVATTHQTGSLSLTGNRPSNTVASSLTPARAGRVVRLQVLSNGSWKTLAQKPQTAATSQSWPIPDPGGRPRQYRLVALGFDGSAPYVGTPLALTPTPAASSLPRITLTTAGSAPVVSKEEYLNGTLQIDNGAPVAMEIKGRGNGTWKLPKKPYRIKLGTKASLLGLPEEKDWVLLANFADRSGLRTWTGFGIAAQTLLAWTPKTAFADVTLNGIDIGLYQLTEQIEATDKPGGKKVQLQTGGLLLEVDTRFPANAEPGFTSTRGTPLVFKDPDEPTDMQKTDVAAAMNAFEDALYGLDYLDPVTGYAKYVDLTSFADWYLVNELMKNLDSDFFSSVYVSWDPAGTFSLGPVWDLDLSSGYIRPGSPTCCESTAGWWLRGDDSTGRQPSHGDHWLTRMTTDPAFVALLEQRWQIIGPKVEAMIAAIPGQQALIAPSSAFDWATWHTDEKQLGGTVHANNQPDEVDYLVDWLTARRTWMDSQLS